MAGSLNEVTLIGHLGADPEIRRTQDGRPIANLRLATTDSWRDKNTGEKREKTEWHTIVIFNEGLAKVAEKYLQKGSKVYVKGALQTRKWQDQSGNDRYSTEVVLQFDGKLIMLGGRDSETGGDRGGGRRNDDRGRDDRREDRGRSNGGGNHSSGSYAGGGFGRDLDDDIPFSPGWRG